MRLDAAISDSGFFWLPEDKDQSCQVPGTLSVSETGRVTLETFGYWSKDPLSLAHDVQPSNLTRIFGYTPERGNVTLTGTVATQINNSSRTDGWVFNRSSFVANRILTGGHFGENEPRFDRLYCAIEGLPEWLGVPAFPTEMDSSGCSTTVTYRHKNPPPLPFQVSDDVAGEFGLTTSVSFRAPVSVHPPDARCIAYVKLSTSMSWTVDDVLQWAFCMRDFISLGTGKPVAITWLEGWKPAGGQEAAIADCRDGRVEILCGSKQQSPKSNTKLLPQFMTFTHKDICSHSVKQWVDLCLDGRSMGGQAVELFCDVLYGNGILPADIQLFKAAESLALLDTIEGYKERDVLWRKIKRQALKFSELLGVDGSEMEEFAKRVADTRHFWVHRTLEGKLHACEGSDLYWLLKQCEALLFCCLTAHVLGCEDAAIRVLRDANPIKDRVRST